MHSINKTCQRCEKKTNSNTSFFSTCNEKIKHYLKKTTYQCLCEKCLAEIEKLVNESDGLSFPKTSQELVEGEHYYIQNGYWIFTEKYHYLRGNCCQNGCKHCVYGYKNKHL